MLQRLTECRVIGIGLTLVDMSIKIVRKKISLVRFLAIWIAM